MPDSRTRRMSARLSGARAQTAEPPMPAGDSAVVSPSPGPPAASETGRGEARVERTENAPRALSGEDVCVPGDIRLGGGAEPLSQVQDATLELGESIDDAKGGRAEDVGQDASACAPGRALAAQSEKNAVEPGEHSVSPHERLDLVEEESPSKTPSSPLVPAADPAAIARPEPDGRATQRVAKSVAAETNMRRPVGGSDRDALPTDDRRGSDRDALPTDDRRDTGAEDPGASKPAEPVAGAAASLANVEDAAKDTRLSLDPHGSYRDALQTDDRRDTGAEDPGAPKSVEPVAGAAASLANVEDASKDSRGSLDPHGSSPVQASGPALVPRNPEHPRARNGPATEPAKNGGPAEDLAETDDRRDTGAEDPGAPKSVEPVAGAAGSLADVEDASKDSRGSLDPHGSSPVQASGPALVEHPRARNGPATEPAKNGGPAEDLAASSSKIDEKDAHGLSDRAEEIHALFYDLKRRFELMEKERQSEAAVGSKKGVKRRRADVSDEDESEVSDSKLKKKNLSTKAAKPTVRKGDRRSSSSSEVSDEASDGNHGRAGSKRAAAGRSRGRGQPKATKRSRKEDDSSEVSDESSDGKHGRSGSKKAAAGRSKGGGTSKATKRSRKGDENSGDEMGKVEVGKGTLAVTRGVFRSLSGTKLPTADWLEKYEFVSQGQGQGASNASAVHLYMPKRSTEDSVGKYRETRCFAKGCLWAYRYRAMSSGWTGKGRKHLEREHGLDVHRGVPERTPFIELRDVTATFEEALPDLAKVILPEGVGEGEHLYYLDAVSAIAGVCARADSKSRRGLVITFLTRMRVDTVEKFMKSYSEPDPAPKRRDWIAFRNWGQEVGIGCGFCLEGTMHARLPADLFEGEDQVLSVDCLPSADGGTNRTAVDWFLKVRVGTKDD